MVNLFYHIICRIPNILHLNKMDHTKQKIRHESRKQRGEYMTKAKGKSGTGRGTDKKGWNRWQASAKKAKSAKPYKSKGTKRTDPSSPQ